jgi:hypothetical protein
MTLEEVQAQLLELWARHGKLLNEKERLTAQATQLMQEIQKNALAINQAEASLTPETNEATTRNAAQSFVSQLPQEFRTNGSATRTRKHNGRAKG